MPTSTGPDPTQPITRDLLLDARLERAKETHRVEVRRIRVVPGHVPGLHVHNGSRGPRHDSGPWRRALLPHL
jgi:hypothetical protein